MDVDIGGRVLEMSMVGEVMAISHTYHETRWEFPPSKFVSYDRSDEVWARPLGFGKLVTVEKTVTIPRAVCLGIVDGSYQFRALSDVTTTSVKI